MLSAFSHFLCLKLKLFRKVVICIFTVVILKIVRNSKSFIPQFQSKSSNSHSFFTIFLGGLIRIFLFLDHFLPLRHYFIFWTFIVSTFFIPVTLQDFPDTLLSDILELQYKQESQIMFLYCNYV